jgi:hypothetical protein
MASLDGLGLDRLDSVAQALAAEADIGTAALGHTLAAWSAFSRGDRSAADLAARAARRANESAPEVACIARLVQVLAVSSEGRPADAAALLLQVIAESRHHAAWLLPLAHAVGADVALAAGRLQSMERHLDEANPTGLASTTDVWVSSLRAQLAVLRHDKPAALRHLADAQRAALRGSQLALHIFAAAKAKAEPGPSSLALAIDVWQLLDDIGLRDHRSVLAPVVARLAVRFDAVKVSRALVDNAPPTGERSNYPKASLGCQRDTSHAESAGRRRPSPAPRSSTRSLAGRTTGCRIAAPRVRQPHDRRSAPHLGAHCREPPVEYLPPRRRDVAHVAGHRLERVNEIP